MDDELSSPQTAMTVDEFDKLQEESAKKRREAVFRHGPCYSEGEAAPLIWHDQVFEREFAPSGTVTCREALRVGSTSNGLDILLVGSHANEGDLMAAAGATITLTLLQADAPDGEFQEVGPTICVKAPTEGIRAEPDHTFARFPVGSFTRPWLKVKLDFFGTITGGNCDCALGYMPR